MEPLKNNWPCCRKPTRFHHPDRHEPGDVIEKQCPTDGRRWKITFRSTSLREIPGLLKLEWEEIRDVQQEQSEASQS